MELLEATEDLYLMNVLLPTQRESRIIVRMLGSPIKSFVFQSDRPYFMCQCLRPQPRTSLTGEGG